VHKNNFSPPVYKARCLLAAIDFNSHKDRELLKDKDGNIRYLFMLHVNIITKKGIFT